MNKDVLIFGGIFTLGGSVLTALCMVLNFNVAIKSFCIGVVGFGFLVLIFGLVAQTKKIIDVDRSGEQWKH